MIACARLGKLGVDLRRVAADAEHLRQALELLIVVPETRSATACESTRTCDRLCEAPQGPPGSFRRLRKPWVPLNNEQEKQGTRT